MQSRLLILPLLASLAALGACQGDNPYRASSLPYPPQPATAANPGLDRRLSGGAARLRPLP